MELARLVLPWLAILVASGLVCGSLALLGPAWWLSSSLGVALVVTSLLDRFEPLKSKFSLSPPLIGLLCALLWAGWLAVLPPSQDYFAIDAFLTATTQQYRVPTTLMVTGLATESMLLPWILGGVVCLAVPFLYSRTGTGPRKLWGVLLLGGLLVWNALYLQPALTAKATMEPTSYNYDGHLYVKAWYLRKSGHGHYESLVLAARGDSRQLPLLNVRGPFLYTLWMLIPAGPGGLLAAYSLGALMACAALWQLARHWGAQELAWLAPVLYLPHLLYCLLTSCTLYVEIWGAWLVLASCWACLKGKERLALFFMLAAALAREHYLLFLGLYGLEYLWRQRERGQTRGALASLVAAAGGFLGMHFYHRWQSAVTLAGFGLKTGEGDQRLAHALYSGWSPSAMSATLYFGWNLHLGGVWMWGTTAVLGLIGLVLARTRPMGPTVLGSVGILLVVYCFLNHHQEFAAGHYLPDYFGATVLPFLMVGVCVALQEAVEMAGHPTESPASASPN